MSSGSIYMQEKNQISAKSMFINKSMYIRGCSYMYMYFIHCPHTHKKEDFLLSSILFMFPSKSSAHWLRAQHASVTLRPIFAPILACSLRLLRPLVFSLSTPELLTALTYEPHELFTKNIVGKGVVNELRSIWKDSTRNA